MNMMDSGRGGLTAQAVTSMGVTYTTHVPTSHHQHQQQQQATVSQVAVHHHQQQQQQQQQQQVTAATVAQVHRLTLQQQQQQQQAVAQAQHVVAQQQAAAVAAAAAAQVAAQAQVQQHHQQQQQQHLHHQEDSLSMAAEIKEQQLGKEEPQGAAFTPPPRVSSVGGAGTPLTDKGTDTGEFEPLIKVEIRGFLPGFTSGSEEKDKNSILQLHFNSVPELVQYFSRSAITQPLDTYSIINSDQLVRSINPDLVRNHFLYLPSSQEATSVRVSNNGYSTGTATQAIMQADVLNAASPAPPASVASTATLLPVGGGKIVVKQERRRGELPPGTIVHRPPNVDSSPNVFVCWICGLDLQKSLQFEEHMVEQHSVDKPYRCEDCGVTFKRKAHLDRHRRIHLPTRPYQCGICGKGFTRNEHVRRHSFTHSGEKIEKLKTMPMPEGLEDRLTDFLSPKDLPVQSPSSSPEDFSSLSGEYFSVPSSSDYQQQIHIAQVQNLVKQSNLPGLEMRPERLQHFQLSDQELAQFVVTDGEISSSNAADIAVALRNSINNSSQPDNDSVGNGRSSARSCVVSPVGGDEGEVTLVREVRVSDDPSLVDPNCSSSVVISSAGSCLAVTSAMTSNTQMATCNVSDSLTTGSLNSLKNIKVEAIYPSNKSINNRVPLPPFVRLRCSSGSLVSSGAQEVVHVSKSEVSVSNLGSMLPNIPSLSPCKSIKQFQDQVNIQLRQQHEETHDHVLIDHINQQQVFQQLHQIQQHKNHLEQLRSTRQQHEQKHLEQQLQQIQEQNEQQLQQIQQQNEQKHNEQLQQIEQHNEQQLQQIQQQNGQKQKILHQVSSHESPLKRAKSHHEQLQSVPLLRLKNECNEGKFGYWIYF